MDSRTLLTKCITLIYRESTLKNTTYDNESLIRTTIGTIKVDNNNDIVFSGHNKLKELKEYILELLDDKTKDYDKSVMLQRLKLLLETDSKLYEAIEQGILPDYEEPATKRVILNLVKSINNYFKEFKIMEVINKASYDLKFNRQSIPNINAYITEVISQLEPLQVSTTSKDPAVVSEVDLSDEKDLTNVFSAMKDNATGGYVLKTGWQGLNRMSQGGFRRGEFIVLGALQHKYKTGFTLSLFAQIAQYNTPCNIFTNQDGSSKKPLLLRISFEDDVLSNLQFLYQYFKQEDGVAMELEQIKLIDKSEAAVYVKSKLGATGYFVKMMRVDPTQWTYKDICNKIIELEAQGYEIHLLMVDYLALIPTTGCTIGPMGSDRRDQFRRIRNFCSSRKITFMTPHQLSTEAKQLIRNGNPEVSFVKDVAERGYFDSSKTLDQEMDLELYLHLFTNKRKTFVTVQRGKHRLPTNIEQEDKYFILQFPNKNSPIPADVLGADTSMSHIPKEASQAASALLQELL